MGFLMICRLGIIGSDNGLASNMWHAIMWTSDGLDYSHIIAMNDDMQDMQLAANFVSKSFKFMINHDKLNLYSRTCEMVSVPAACWGHRWDLDSKVHGAIMGPIWGQQDPSGPHVGHMNFVLWGFICSVYLFSTGLIIRFLFNWIKHKASNCHDD